MRTRSVFAVILMAVALTAGCAQTRAAQPEWKLTQNILPECRLQSLADSGSTLPDLAVTYHKDHSYLDYEAWTGTCTLNPALDLSRATRFTCWFQTDAPGGYYSGRWALRLTDSRGVTADYMIDKEAWRARQPVFVELALVGNPPNFDSARVVKVAVLGNVSVPAQTATVKVSQLNFDGNPIGEADARRKARWQSLQAQAPASASFLIHPIPVSFKPYRDGWQSMWNTKEAPAPVAMDTARGGHDDSQVLLFPSKRAASTVQVRASALVGPGGARIAGSNVKLYQMLWVPTLPAGRPDIYEGWYPDILEPIPSGRMAMSRDSLSDLWIDVQAPRDAKPGVYTGRVVLTQGKVARIVPIRLTVHNFSLPERPTLTTSFWLLGDRLAPFLGKKQLDLTFADYKPYVDMALENEVTPILYGSSVFHFIPKSDGTYGVDLSKWEQYYGYVMSHGGNCIDLGDNAWFGSNYLYPGNVSFPGETAKDAATHEVNGIPEFRQQILKTYLDTAHEFLKKHNWDQYSYLQLYDEIPGRADIMTVVYPVVKSVSPDTKIAQTRSPLPSYAQWVDIPIPTMPAVDNPAAPRGYTDTTKAQGKYPWFYSCSSFGICIPEVAVRDRMIPLYAFNSKADAYLFWSLNQYNTPKPDFPQKPWDGYRSNNGVSEVTGDGILIYPSAHSGGALMPASRLKVFRDGMEDYEFLHTLDTLYAQKKNNLSASEQQAVLHILALDSLLAAAWEQPELVTQRRAEAGRWIDRLSQL